MRECWPALVEEIIDAELDPGPDDPAKGAEVVIDGVRDEEWVRRVDLEAVIGWEGGMATEEGKEVDGFDWGWRGLVVDGKDAESVDEEEGFFRGELEVFPVENGNRQDVFRFLRDGEMLGIPI